MKKVFNEEGTFKANYAAEEWLTENGYSYGEMQRFYSRGIVKGQTYIAKWEHYSEAERGCFDGLMTGNFREGPVTVEIKDEVFEQ